MMEKLNALLASASDFALHKLLPAAGIFVIGFFVVKIILKIITKIFTRSKLEKPVSTLILAVLKVVLYLLLCLIAASSLGIDVTGVVALASVLTLAISLSVQDALTNLIGGFTLFYTKPFAIGDYAEISGQSGTVQQIGLTYTKLLTSDGKIVSIPNSAVVSAQIVNYSANGTRRAEIRIGVSYDNDPALVLQALKQAVQVPTALQEPAPYAAVASYGESAVEYVLLVWSSSENYWVTLHGINQNINTVFREMGVTMTYPHLNVHLDKP